MRTLLLVISLIAATFTVNADEGVRHNASIGDELFTGSGIQLFAIVLHESGEGSVTISQTFTTFTGAGSTTTSSSTSSQITLRKGEVGMLKYTTSTFIDKGWGRSALRYDHYNVSVTYIELNKDNTALLWLSQKLNRSTE